MFIENLKFIVSPVDKIEDFLKADEEIWTTQLRRQPGFIRKDSAYEPNGLVTLWIYWDDGASMTKAARRLDMNSLDLQLRSKFAGSFFALNNNKL